MGPDKNYSPLSLQHHYTISHLPESGKSLAELVTGEMLKQCLKTGRHSWGARLQVVSRVKAYQLINITVLFHIDVCIVNFVLSADRLNRCIRKLQVFRPPILP